MPSLIYGFEAPLDLETLPRPPMAALRAMRSSGMLVSQAGWQAMPLEARRGVARAGQGDPVDPDHVRGYLMAAPPREVRMLPRVSDPPVNQVPEHVLYGAGPGRPVPLRFWQALTPLDRHVLSMLSGNTRLLWRALDELMVRTRGGSELATTASWTGELAHCEIKTTPHTARRLHDPAFHEGRATILARVAGIRAARWAGDLLDLASHVVTGPVELGFRSLDEAAPGILLCQAHVSTSEGDFFRGGSLLAASTAAVALVEMVKDVDPLACVQGVTIAEERWMVAEEDETTLGA